MRQAAILVEGQTEEAFVNRVLGPHLATLGVAPTPVLLETSRSPAGVKRGGGASKWGKIDRDLRGLLAGSHWLFVTTMLDYFRLPPDTPGYADRPGPGRDAVLHIQAAIAASFPNARLLPYLSLHEFEALLFANPSALGEHSGQRSLTQDLELIVAKCGEPEAIDDGPATAPSKRIAEAWPRYSKVTDSVAVLSRVGLPTLRERCPHFAAWVSEMEQRIP